MAIGGCFSGDALSKVACLWPGRCGGLILPFCPTHLPEWILGFWKVETSNIWLPCPHCVTFITQLGTNYLCGSLCRATIPHLRTSAASLSERTSSFPHPHPCPLYPNPPVIIPPNVPFSCIIRIYPCVCIHTCLTVFVWLIELSAGCDLCLLDSKAPRAGIAFYSFLLLCPPNQLYASP